MDEQQQRDGSRADFWTSIVLLSVSTAMLFQTLTYPLRGTYAGVRNAWYVSPALFPLIVAAGLIVLGLMLLARAIKVGGARGAMDALAKLGAGRPAENATIFWITAALLVAYVYGLVPRVDFIAATSLFLLCFTIPFHLNSARVSRIVLVLFFATTGIGVAVDVVFEPGTRTAAAFMLDGLVWLVFLAASTFLLIGFRRDAASRRSVRHCVLLSGLVPLVLGTVFKYGLLVPLPHEGVTVAVTDGVRAVLRSMV